MRLCGRRRGSCGSTQRSGISNQPSAERLSSSFHSFPYVAALPCSIDARMLWMFELTSAGLKSGALIDESAMALENCTLCRGTGWKLVPRADGAGGKVAVTCDCGMEARASLVMERAHIPKRYEHCDFESYSTDVGSTPQQTESLKKAKLLTEGFVREYPGSS